MTIASLPIEARIGLERMHNAISNQLPIKEKLEISIGYAINIHIIDYSQPLLFTFDNLHISRNMEGTTFEHRKGWGYDYVVDKGWNICSFLESDYTRWYRHPSFIAIMKYIESKGLFKNYKSKKIAYGSSMGGYAATYTKALSANVSILFNPCSTLNAILVPWETRESYSAPCNNWQSKYHDAIDGCLSSENYIIYDPTFKLDYLHVNRFVEKCAQTIQIRVPGVGHSIPGHLTKIDVLDLILTSIVTGNYLSSKLKIFEALKKRRNYAGYHKFMLSLNPQMTDARKQIVMKYCLTVLGDKYSQPTQASLFYRDASDLYAFYDRDTALTFIKKAATLKPDCPKINKRLNALLPAY
ncbi:hypothetical protein [Psychrobacter sp. SWN149]|uniref:hypothetical protein n=1 Tax=Psychrobacter sp. SWN149 TaxID=2792057 RepID=UPI0018CED7D8|nr:hypothetical protein [Psychrobacter sp. SWN149]MBH0005391.1 hypothetical protein [Psychrobacter sp. SWN149]